MLREYPRLARYLLVLDGFWILVSAGLQKLVETDPTLIELVCTLIINK